MVYGWAWMVVVSCLSVGVDGGVLWFMGRYGWW